MFFKSTLIISGLVSLELSTSAATCDHPPGAQPKSSIFCPFFMNLYFWLISNNLKAPLLR